jgi:hypothetical protein
MNKHDVPWDGSSGLICQNVVDVVIANYCQRQSLKSYSFELSWTKTRVFARVGATSTEPHHRFEVACGGEGFSRSLRGHRSRGTACPLRSCLGRHVARMWQRCAARSLRQRSDYLHSRRCVRRSACYTHYAPLLLLYILSPNITIFYIYTFLTALSSRNFDFGGSVAMRVKAL